MSKTDTSNPVPSQGSESAGVMDVPKDALLSRSFFNVVNVFYIDKIKGEEFAVPPFFKEHLQNILNEDGKVVKFCCSVSGFPFPEIQWFKGLTQIAEGENEKLNECVGYKYYASNDNGNLILVITNVTQEDLGPYTCKIRNKIGEARSTAMLYSQPLPGLEALTAPQGQAKNQRKKIIIRETITIVEKKSPVLIESSSKSTRDIVHHTTHQNGGNTSETIHTSSTAHHEQETHKNVDNQKVTVKFAIPKNCETKNISVATVTKSLFDEEKTDHKNDKSSAATEMVPLSTADEKSEKSMSISSEGFAQDSFQTVDDDVLSDTEFSESEVENRQKWIKCGENSGSEFRRNSIPCPLPPCFRENTADVVTPFAATSSKRPQPSSQDTNEVTRPKEDSGLRFQIDEDREKDANDDESKDVISRQCSILSELSASSVFYTPSNETNFQAFGRRYHSSERSDYFDVFEKESKKGRAATEGMVHHDEGSETSELFPDNGLETYSDISPISPDAASIAEHVRPKSAGTVLGCTGFFKTEEENQKSTIDTDNQSQGFSAEYEGFETTVRKRVEPTSPWFNESCRAETKSFPSGVKACEDIRDTEEPQREEKRYSLNREMALLNEKFADGEVIMELDELIEKLLQFSQENDVFVSSLKIGYRNKSNGSVQSYSFLNENAESTAPPLMLSSAVHYVADEHTTKTIDEATQSDNTVAARKEVGQKPEFVIPLQDIEVETDEDIVLNVSVTGSPAPRITWSRDGIPLDEDEGGVILDNLMRHSAVYTCVAANEWGESRSTAKLTVKPIASVEEDVEKVVASTEEKTPLSEIRMRERKSTQSPTKRRSQIISASLVDYLRAKAITVQQARIFEKLKLLETRKDGQIKRDSPSICKENTMRAKSVEGLAREDLTIRRGSIISLDSLTTTSYASADEELTSSDTAVWEEVLSTGEEDFMSTDEFFSHKRSDDDLFCPRPVTPTPGNEPPTIYEVTKTRTLRPFTRQPTFPAFTDFTTTSSEEMETATSGNATPVPPRGEEIFPFSPGVESHAPRLLETLDDQTVIAGSTCILKCSVLGYPTPQIAWYRNGIRIQGSANAGAISPRSFLTPTSSSDFKSYSVPQRFSISSEEGKQRDNKSDTCTVHTLTICDARITDTGEYTVTAMNVYGSIVTTVQVLVKKMDDALHDPSLQSAPRFVSYLGDSDGMVEEEAVMTFQVVGIPEPEVTVIHNKEEVHNDKFILTKADMGKYTLTIRVLQLEDEGEVRIRASNSIGHAECSAELFVDERTVTPTPAKYIIPQWSDHCDISFEGAVEDQQDLATQVIAPYFDEITEDVVTTPGSTASFVVRVYAWPAPEIRWYKDGQQLEQGPRISFESTDFGSHVLKIGNVTENDAGLYTCVVENSEGSESCKAELIMGRERSSSASSSEERKSELPTRRLKDYYVIQKEIACGAFSMVRLAISKADGTRHAAKYIKSTGSESREKRRSEIEILSKLSHENIVRYNDCFETKKHLVLILEHLDTEWFEFLLQKDTVYEYEIAEHVRQICAGIAYLHENKIVHLDLKPENLMVVEDESVMKIVDFGSAYELEDGQELKWDYGNPEFVSPEVVSGTAISTASDMWSLGVIIYVVISGLSPFVGESDYITVLQVRSGKWHFDNRWFTTVSDLANDFVGKLLVLDANKRMLAADAGKHPWLQMEAKTEADVAKVSPLPDGRLKYFLSRRKWQRSLVTPSTSLVLRPISSLLQREYDSTSVAVSRTAISDDVSSSTVTESDDEIDDTTTNESLPHSAAYRARAARMQEAAKNVREFIYDDRKDSILIENWIEQRQIDAEAELPEVTVTASSPKTSPERVRKQTSVETVKESIAEHETEENANERQLHKDESQREPRTVAQSREETASPSQRTRLSSHTRMKLSDKKVSFEDELDYSPDIITEEPFSYIKETYELEATQYEETDGKVNRVPETPPMQPPETAKSPTLPVITATKASSLDRPQSVTKLLKEDKKMHKMKRGADSENISTKDKIKKKLSLMTSRRQRSLDIPDSSSSSDEETKERKSIKETLTPTRSKFSFFSRRKKPLTKGRSLDLPLETHVAEPQLPPDSSPVLSNKSQPIKGILKRGGSSDTNSLSDPHIQQSLRQTSRSPSPQATDTNREGVFSPRRYQRKPLTKGVSLDLEIVAEGSATNSLPSRHRSRPVQTASERRRLQMQRGSSAESALPPIAPRKPRVSGLRGPLMEKSVDQDDEEPMAGMSLRRSLPNGEEKTPTHTRSYSAASPLGPQYTTTFERGKLSPRSPVSAPPRRLSPMSRGAFFSQSIDIGGTTQRMDILPTENSLKDRKTLSLQLPLPSRPLSRSRSHERPLARRQRSSERRQGECYAPTLKSHLLDQGVTQNQTCVNFVCVIDALPLPEVVWYKDNEELNSSDKYEVILEPSLSKYQLKLRTVKLPEDCGEYSCEARNSVGALTTSCNLKPAVIPGKPSAPELSGSDGSNVWVTWNPPNNCALTPLSYMLQYREMAAMKWVLVDEAIKDTLYKIENLRPTTSYRFRVRAANNAGVGPFSKVSHRIQLDPRKRTQPLQYTF